MDKIRLAIFASGNGTNAINIINYFKNHETIQVERVYSNKLSAPVLEKAKNLGLDTVFFHMREMKSLTFPTKLEGVDYIILAGFLWLIPKHTIKAFKNKILNIHPALLPKFGGKGMYGMYVHRAVIEAGEKESGITIHKVNKDYDEGEIVFQAKCSIDEADTPESLAEKIQELEYEYYPRVIEEYVLKNQ